MDYPKNILVFDEQQALLTGVTYSQQHYAESNGNKNYFEDVVDQMMANKFNEKIRQKIYALPKNKQRRAILALLQHYQPKRKLFTEIEKNYLGMSKTEYLKFIIKVFCVFVTVAEVDIKKYGEIMTPLRLVKKMISKLPNSVWSNPNLKWADVCNGTGPFLVLVIYRLMLGLESWEPDEEKRYKHIVENMIYAGELQPTNMFLWIYLIDPLDEYTLNVFTGSFLKEGFDYHMKNVWGLEKFDIIVGNPPYMEHKDGFNKSQPIWDRFVEKSIRLLNDGGYLSIVHPSGWRNVDGVFKKTQKLLRSKQILFLSIHDEKDGKKIFGAETRFDYYCLRNVDSNNSNTEVECQDGTIENVCLSDLEFIPNAQFDKIFKLMARGDDDKVTILYSRSAYGTDKQNMSKTQSDTFKYPCIYTVPKGDKLNLFYSSTMENGHFGISKMIWSNGRIISVGSLIDADGEYGLTQFSYAIVDKKENLYNLKKVFDSKEFRDLMELCAVGELSINRKVIGLFKKDFWKEFI